MSSQACRCAYRVHRWDCPLTPRWAETVEKLGAHPWPTDSVATSYDWLVLERLVIDINVTRPAFEPPPITPAWVYVTERQDENGVWHVIDAGAIGPTHA